MIKLKAEQLIAVAALLWAAAVPAQADGTSAPDAGRPFEPSPRSQALYGISSPHENPARQRHVVHAADGVELFVETWLPAEKDGNVPPERIPTILLITPYGHQGEPRNADDGLLEALVPYGYALAQMHVRGTGESGGCLEFIGANEASDAARVIEYLGGHAPWSNRRVAGIGISYDGGAMIAAAGGGDPRRTRYLKAITTLAPAATFYDLGYFDGVPHFAADAVSSPVFTAFFSLPPGERTTLGSYGQKDDCQPDVLLGSVNPNGDFTRFAHEREWRRYAHRIRAATLMVHGHADTANMPLLQAGLFERLPKTTPKAGIFGVFGHEFPHRHWTGVRPEWERTDFWLAVRAWFDRYTKGLSTGVAQWPPAQVQGSDGQWRAEPEWPTTGGPVGQLALSEGGELGAARPAGAASYVEGGPEVQGAPPPPGTAAVFETSQLPERLEITGQPVLDAWLSLDKPDAHVAARIDALDAEGTPLPAARSVGFRSMQHLAPLRNNRFVQRQGRPAPVGSPVHVRLRFNPTDIVVPAGGRLRLALAGSLNSVDPILLVTEQDTPVKDPSQPSGAAARVTVHHDCDHPTILRFVMPRRRPELLNVREKDEPAEVPLQRSVQTAPRTSDAGGMATAPVCGRAPRRLPHFGRARAR